MAIKQQTLPADGMARFTNSEIDEAAEEFRALRDARMATGIKEKEAKALLIQKMQAHAQTVYGYVDADGYERTVRIDSQINVKVAKNKGQGTSEDQDEDPSAGDATVQ